MDEIKAEFPNSVLIIVNVIVFKTKLRTSAASEASSHRQQKWPQHWGCSFTITKFSVTITHTAAKIANY